MEQIEYTRIVVPSSMRSPYWKYFGFPSDNSNNILTRQKIVCTICNAAIAYNKNTSNLRTHLMSKHIETFRNIITPSNATLASRQTEELLSSDKEITAISDKKIVVEKFVDRKRRLIENHESDVPAPLESENHIVENCLTITEFSSNNFESETNNNVQTGTGAELEIQNADYIAFLPSNDTEMIMESRDEVFSTTTLNERKNESEFTYTERDADLHQQHEEHIISMDIILADLVQTDLSPINTLEENGFCKYNQQLTGLKLDNNTVERVTKVIETRFTNINQMVVSHICCLSQSQPYSLGFEIYKDNEEQEILNIYFNYLDENKIDLISILYTNSTISIGAVNISELVGDINLKNCSGVVVTCLDSALEFISDFTKSYDLPLIECLESMLTRCLEKIFEIKDIRTDYEKLLKIFLQNKSQTPHIKGSNFRPRCQWNKLNFLEYVFKNVEQNKLEEWTEIRRSFEYLKPLKNKFPFYMLLLAWAEQSAIQREQFSRIAMDIITDEALPLSSLTRPLIKKLFEEYFNSINQEESRITKIQKIVKEELYERAMGKHFLNEVTFFDLRFHRDFALQEPFFNINNLKIELNKRFKHISEVNCLNKPNNTNIEHNSLDSFENIRKSISLKSFFKRDDSLKNFDVTTDLKTNLDLEIDQYQALTCLDLDQSPILWWQQQSETYKQLSKIANRYLTIPCCCLPRLSRMDLEQKYSKLDRRKNLSQFCNAESKLWYLYYNDGVTELL